MNVPSHPHGILPSGNLLSGRARDRQSGGLFAALSDDLLAHLLSFVTDWRDLVRLGATCRRLYAFSLPEDVWKEHYVAAGSEAPWRGSWRRSFLQLPLDWADVRIGGIHSDLLYRPFLNAHVDLQRYLPRAGRQSGAIKRYTDMTAAEFASKHANEPFILTEPVKGWPAMQRWSLDNLQRHYGAVNFRAECADWALDRYLAYMRDNADESPLYLFDARFAEKTAAAAATTTGAGSLGDDYTVPPAFSEDVLDCLGSARPDHRWLIVGPARSGSTFHKDPNGTCAWNAVVAGSKYWIMLPPDCPPPGVVVSDDEAEVHAPCSIAEWLLSHHADARQYLCPNSKSSHHSSSASAPRGAREAGRMLEGVCSAGEVLYVPSGWWHLVVNLDDCVAVTQNFVPPSLAPRVWAFLRDKADQVSGFRDEFANRSGNVPRYNGHAESGSALETGSGVGVGGSGSDSSDGIADSDRSQTQSQSPEQGGAEHEKEHSRKQQQTPFEIFKAGLQRDYPRVYASCVAAEALGNTHAGLKRKRESAWEDLTKQTEQGKPFAFNFAGGDDYDDE